MFIEAGGIEALVNLLNSTSLKRSVTDEDYDVIVHALTAMKVLLGVLTITQAGFYPLHDTRKRSSSRLRPPALAPQCLNHNGQRQLHCALSWAGKRESKGASPG